MRERGEELATHLLETLLDRRTEARKFLVSHLEDVLAIVVHQGLVGLATRRFGLVTGSLQAGEATSRGGWVALRRDCCDQVA